MRAYVGCIVARVQIEEKFADELKADRAKHEALRDGKAEMESMFEQQLAEMEDGHTRAVGARAPGTRCLAVEVLMRHSAHIVYCVRVCSCTSWRRRTSQRFKSRWSATTRW